MLRTLAINSNKKCVKFWCFDSFFYHQSNMRLRRVLWNPCKEYTRTRRPDTPLEGIRTTYPGRNCTRLPPFYTRLSPFTPGCALPFCTRLPPFAPGCALSFCTRLPPFTPGCRALSTRMFTFWNSDAGWESSHSAQCCYVLLKLPDIFHRYFGIF